MSSNILSAEISPPGRRPTNLRLSINSRAPARLRVRTWVLSRNPAVKHAVGICVFLALFMAAVHAVRAEVIFFDDSRSQAIVPPTSSRWEPGHSLGICVSSTALPGSLCGPGSATEEAVWGYLLPPSLGATVDTNIANYGGLPPIPFNDFLWVTEPYHVAGDPYSDYLVSILASDFAWIYLQFNSAFAEGFHCTDILVPTSCTQPHTIAEQNGVVTAGYVRWSDGSFDQITFQSAEHVPEPSSLPLLAAGYILLVWRLRKARPRFG